MKTLIYSFVRKESWTPKKTTSKIVLVAFLMNIFGPTLTYASLPNFGNTLAHPNVPAVAQVNEVKLPRDLVAWDILDISFSWTLITQTFSWTHLETAQLLNDQIDALSEVISIYDDSLRTFIVTAEIPGVPFVIWDLHITSQAINPSTPVDNVVAIAQESELSIPQQLFAWDNIYFTVEWISIDEAFAWDTDTTLANFANSITQNTIASWSFDNISRKINLTAKTPWTGFSMSNLRIVSTWVPVLNTVANVVPVSQIEKISFPRIIYPDETISLSVSGTVLTQAYAWSSAETLNELNSQINSLGFVSSSISAWDITITSTIPWNPFTVGSIDITWWTVNSVNFIPNQIAVSQEDIINIPRDVFLWDTINLYISWATISQWFTLDSDYTIGQLMAQINASDDYQVSAYNNALRNITIQAKSAGKAFTHPTLNVTSAFASTNQTLNQVAQRQISNYNFPRDLVPWDQISSIINWSPITMDFATWSIETLTSFAENITSSNSGVLFASFTWGNIVELQATVEWVWFTAQNLTITNTLAPVVLIPNVTPVKQKETVFFANELVAWDTITLTLSWETINQTLIQGFNATEDQTLSDLSTQINSLSDFTSQVIGKNLVIESKKAWIQIAVTDISTQGQSFSWQLITPNLTETKAAIRFNVNSVPGNDDTLTIWECIVSFDNVWTENDCSDQAANLDVSWINDPSTAATLMRWLVWVTDANQWPLTTWWVGSEVVFSALNTPVISTDISYDLSDIDWNISLSSLTNPSIPQAKVETLNLPRSFAPGDSMQIVVDGITVTQNFLSSAWVSFNNLVTQLNALPNTSATWSNSTITITAKTPWLLFDLSSAQFVNSQVSQTTVSNVLAVAQSENINFPAPFAIGDLVTVTIDWVQTLTPFATDSSTTMGNLIFNINSQTSVSATASWAAGMVLTAKTAWEPFVIDKLEIKNTTPIVNTSTNVPWVAQIDVLAIPFVPTSTDNLNVIIDWTTLTQGFVWDATTTLSALNTQIDNLSNVNSSYDTASGAFTITSSAPGTPFAAWFSNIWAIINSTNVQPNVESWSQVDNLVIERDLATGDQLSLVIANSTLTQAFLTDKVATLTALNDQINALSEVDSIYDGAQMFTITSSTPGTPFTSWILTITSVNSSVNQVPNVPAVAQVENVTLPRNLIEGDKLSVDLSGTTVSQDFTGSQATTLTEFANAINSSFSWAIATTLSNTVTFTASVPWVQFDIANFIIENTSLATTTVNNVVAVKQESVFDIPTFVLGDQIVLTINATPITQAFTTDHPTTVAELLNKIDASTVVNSQYQSWTTIHMRSTVAGTPFTVSQVSIVNTTIPSLKVENVVPEAQVVNMYPAWTLREAITFRVTVNWTEYDYLTLATDWIPEIITWLQGAISNTWVTVSSWSDISWQYLELTSSIPGIAFTYDSQAIDITPPVVIMPISAQETLKSGSESTSNVQINEDWAIYMVLSWSVITTELDIANAIWNKTAFIVSSPANSNTDYTVTVPVWALDWMYDFIAVDEYHNVSQIIPGWLTVDNTAPIVNISTPTQIVNSDSISINWTTEANTNINIISWQSNINIVSDWAWSFSWVVGLNINAVNQIEVSATDIAGNVWSGSVTITQDSLTPSPFILNGPAYTNSWSANMSVTTESWIYVEVYASGALIQSWTTDLSWFKNFNVPLVSDTVNSFFVLISDAAWNTASGNILIVQDSIAPNIILDPLPTMVHLSNINISWTTEPNSTVVLDNSWVTASAIADWVWAFSATIWLNQVSGEQYMNNINVTATDPAWNSSSTWVSILEDSIPNALIINTPSFHTQLTTITVSGSTRAGSTVDIAWWAAPVSVAVDVSGNFSLDVNLNSNLANILLVTSTDQVGNAVSGSITVTNDTITPTVNITTPNHPTNSQVISIVWTTEPNSTISITWWSGSFNWVSDNVWNFNIPAELNLWIQNDLVVTSTDQAWNSWVGNISITHDPVVVFVTLWVQAINWTNQDSFSFTWTTKSGATVDVTWGSWTLNLIADASWAFSWNISLNINSQNNIVVSATDDTLTTMSESFIVNHDNVAPELTLSQTWTINTNLSDIVLNWLTEANATVSLTNWVSTIDSVADAGWTFSLTFPLVWNSTNNITWTVTDLAGNISTWASLTVVNDNVWPVISNLTVNPVIAGPILNANFTFETNETSESTFYIWSWANVFATLLATWATSWTSHAWVIPGLTPNATYYYFVQSTDAFGNSSQTAISTINTIDSSSPLIISKNISNITNAWAQLDFNFQDAHFNTWTLASGNVDISNWVTSSSLIPNVTYSNAINSWDLTFTWLISNTIYNYTITLRDDFGNQTISAGSFLTAGNVTLGWWVVSQTGSATLPTWGSWVTSLEGTTIIISSNPSTATISWSLIVPWNIEILSWTWWNWTISSPTLVDANSSQALANSELSPIVTAMNNSTTTFAWTVQQTIFAWWNMTLTASGWLFTITADFTINLAGQTLYIYRSPDWINWTANTPASTCVVSAGNACTFQSSSLSYFGFATIAWSPIVIPTPTPVQNSQGGWGWNSAVDYCPSWDTSPSYYDSSCGTLLTSTATWATTTATWTAAWAATWATSTVDQDATRYILDTKQDNYPQATTTEQKVDLWQKVIKEMNEKLENPSITQDQANLYNNIITKAKSLLDDLQSEIEFTDKIIDKSANNEFAWTEILTDDNENISLNKFIEVDHVVVVRSHPSYKWKIVAYLPRNYKVELIKSDDLWSEIGFGNGQTAFIRNKFLRDENRQDRGRTASQLVFLDVTLQANVDMRKIKVDKSVWVRKWPGKEYDKTGYLNNEDNVLILDSKSVNGWYEIRSQKWTGWVFGKYIDDDKR
ncbi:MAG: hypothetical protein ACD_3C00059G0001 [uncultured bacterium (gcode 4)]|uniref:SH3b domain-containing protein n=1 Tax=uncultured bacterium (gcode 4) TaxID=1234023 RepID=K2FZP0_9BACT|nr:MAG: hypothetical protein ACD_3C00059G0001 [uncultured bacterium (gcode 4)]